MNRVLLGIATILTGVLAVVLWLTSMWLLLAVIIGLLALAGLAWVDGP